MEDFILREIDRLGEMLLMIARKLGLLDGGTPDFTLTDVKDEFGKASLPFDLDTVLQQENPSGIWWRPKGSQTPPWNLSLKSFSIRTWTRTRRPPSSMTPLLIWTGKATSPSDCILWSAFKDRKAHIHRADTGRVPSLVVKQEAEIDAGPPWEEL